MAIPKPDAPHTEDDQPLSAEGMPAAEGLEQADLDKRLGEDPTEVPTPPTRRAGPTRT